jgi:mono/diheme cytochrome c family protein
MRYQRLAAALLTAGALGVGVLAGCGQKADDTNGAGDDTLGSSTPVVDTLGTGGAVSLAVGERVYQERCVLCHGPQGKGDGPGAAALNPKPRNHTDHTYMGSRTDEQLLEMIRNGKGQMPAWKTILTDAEIRSVLMKVRSLDPQYRG